jgi:uncharacterized protein YaiE (UPF0345 family)
MMTKKYFKFIISFALVLFLSVGYAVVSSVNLTITGSVSGESRELNVYFNGQVENTSMNSSKVRASASGKNGTLTISNLTLNEALGAKFLVVNNEKDVDANVVVSYYSNEYFKTRINSSDFNATSGGSTGGAVTMSLRPVAIWAEDPPSTFSFTIPANSKKWLEVGVQLIKTPISEAASTYNINVSIEASPVSATA